jgi:cell surface protein SprA
MSVRDTKTIQRKIEGENTITQGNVNFQFKPTVNYLVNERLTVQGYFERSVNTPWSTISYPRTVMRAGFNLRYSLSQ